MFAYVGVTMSEVQFPVNVCNFVTKCNSCDLMQYYMALEILFQFFLSQPTFLELFHVGEGSSNKNLLALEQIFT